LDKKRGRFDGSGGGRKAKGGGKRNCYEGWGSKPRLPGKAARKGKRVKKRRYTSGICWREESVALIKKRGRHKRDNWRGEERILVHRERRRESALEEGKRREGAGCMKLP